MIDPFTYELTAKMADCELTGDQAVEAILSRFVRISRPSLGNERARVYVVEPQLQSPE